MTALWKGEREERNGTGPIEKSRRQECREPRLSRIGEVAALCGIDPRDIKEVNA